MIVRAPVKAEKFYAQLKSALKRKWSTIQNHNMGLFKRKSGQFDQELTNRLRDASPENTELIKSLLAQGANPNAPKKDGKSAPLITAATVGSILTMDVLIQHGADPNLYSGIKWHETPLVAAIQENQIQTVEFLIEHGANIDGSVRTGPPLSSTFFTKNIEMLKCLLRHGADPNKKLLGLATPARQAEATLGCRKHDIRKLPKVGCAKCGDRLLLIRGMLGQIGIQGPVTSLEGMLGCPDLPLGRGFERIETKHTDRSEKYRAATGSYKRQLMDWQVFEENQ